MTKRFLILSRSFGKSLIIIRGLSSMAMKKTIIAIAKIDFRKRVSKTQG